MDMREIVERLLHEDARHLGELTKGCGSCRRFVHWLKKKPILVIGWDDVPEELLKRFSLSLRERLCWY